MIRAVTLVWLFAGIRGDENPPPAYWLRTLAARQ